MTQRHGCRLTMLCAAMVASMLAPSGMARAQPPAGEIKVLTIIDVIPDYAMPQNVETSAALLDRLAADTRHAPGLLSFRILRDATRPNHFVIEGVWTDMKSFERYSGAGTTRGFRQAFQPRQGGPFDERIYVDLK